MQNPTKCGWKTSFTRKTEICIEKLANMVVDTYTKGTERTYTATETSFFCLLYFLLFLPHRVLLPYRAKTARKWMRLVSGATYRQLCWKERRFIVLPSSYMVVCCISWQQWLTFDCCAVSWFSDHEKFLTVIVTKCHICVDSLPSVDYVDSC